MTNQPLAKAPPGVTVVRGHKLHDEVRALAQQANFAALSTLLPDGQPQTQLTWVDADDKCVLINTLPFTQKYRNAARDPRTTVLVIDRTDPEHYAEVRGRVVEILTGEPALQHVQRLAHRYLGAENRRPAERVVLRIEPFRQVIRKNPWHQG